MHDHSQGTYAAGNISRKSAAAGEKERRSEDRQPFTAAAEVVDLGSDARFSTRTTDLSAGGCFVDTIVPFPVDSKVRVTIRKENVQFEAVGLVVYSQAGLGMGIAFDQLDRRQDLILGQWLGDSTPSAQESDPDSGSPLDRRPAVSIGSDHAVLVRLVRLMIIKGILSETEGSSIFNDPVFF